MDEDGYESTDQYQVWDRREYFTQKVFNACHALFYHEPLNTKETFNEFYFKKCVCAAIIYRTTDNYLESNKDSAKRQTGFWYKAGGYKLDIVPYSIAKIISSIPAGYVLDWNLIWQKQAVSPAFMREIEIVTKMTNDFICDSHGVIVTEYCHIFLWTLFIKYCYTTKFNFSFQKGFDGYCDYFLADCFICE